MMHHIRPYRLFTLVDAPPAERMVNIMIPRGKGYGNVSLLETFLLLAATRVISARRIFEIGTFLGTTTLHLALNTPDDTQIFTLDLDNQHIQEVRQHAADVEATRMHLAAAGSLAFEGTPVAHKIKTVSGNSIAFDFSPWQKSVDLAFIDGGHDLATVQSDTGNAFKIVSDGPSCVLWHDYRNPDYPELTGYLEKQSREREIFHIEDTMLCAWFNDPEQRILPRLTEK